MSNLLSVPTESSLYKRQYSVFLRSPKYKIPSAHRKQEICAITTLPAVSYNATVNMDMTMPKINCAT